MAASPAAWPTAATSASGRNLPPNAPKYPSAPGTWPGRAGMKNSLIIADMLRAGGPRPRAVRAGLLDLEGGRVLSDAVAAPASGTTGRDRAQRPHRSHRHRDDPRSRHSQGLT